MSTVVSQTANTFKQLNISPLLQRGITAAGFADLRPIQAQTIPDGLAGRDILGLAQTGTGKTAAFALPLLAKVLSTPRHGPQGLVVAPTRELALQITAEIRMLARFTDVRVLTVIGGVPASSQISGLRRSPDILVACPGRLLDLYQQRVVRLDQIQILVLDEADHMFDMGFLPDIRRVIAALPAKRQNLLFSATMPREIRRLADDLLQRPKVVDLNQSRPVETVDHSLYPVHHTQKTGLLRHILQKDDPASAIIFTRTKHRAKKLAQQLDRWGYRVTALQGNMSQSQRVRAMEGFRRRDFRILVATDIAARGIDVEQVSHVINFDIPNTPDAYTHRIGRTGRSEREGKAITFVTADDFSLVREVERKLGAEIPRESLSGVSL